MSLTAITVTGTVSKAPEQRYTQNNTSVLNFTIQVARYDNKAKQEKLYPVSITVWGDAGSPLLEKLAVNKRVCVVGRLQINQFTDKAGKNVRVAEIDASSVTVLSEISDDIVMSADAASFDASPLEEAPTASAGSEEIPF